MKIKCPPIWFVLATALRWSFATYETVPSPWRSGYSWCSKGHEIRSLIGSKNKYLPHLLNLLFLLLVHCPWMRFTGCLFHLCFITGGCCYGLFWGI